MGYRYYLTKVGFNQMNIMEGKKERSKGAWEKVINMLSQSSQLSKNGFEGLIGLTVKSQ